MTIGMSNGKSYESLFDLLNDDTLSHPKEELPNLPKIEPLEKEKPFDEVPIPLEPPVSDAPMS